MYDIENCSFTELKKLQIILDTEEVAYNSMIATQATVNHLTNNRPSSSDRNRSKWLSNTWVCSLSVEEFAIINQHNWNEGSIKNALTRTCCN